MVHPISIVKERCKKIRPNIHRCGGESDTRAVEKRYPRKKHTLPEREGPCRPPRERIANAAAHPSRYTRTAVSWNSAARSPAEKLLVIRLKEFQRTP